MSLEQSSLPEDSTALGALRSNQLIAGRFRVENFIGRGGMGVVWSARDEVLRKQRALKFLSDDLAHDDSAKADLADEVARCQELTHLHILRVHDFVEDKARNLVAVSMELVAGGTLSGRRVRQPHRWIEPEVLLPWVEQLCAALTYAHDEAGIVHRDLKPSNLLLDGRDRLKLADFGISQALTAALTRFSRPSIGFSLAYSSPEQLQGQKPTAAQDLYSLGATLYEMLTGKPPFFTGDIAAQTLQRVPDSIVSRRKDLENVHAPVPGQWEEVIAQLLCKDPTGRPASAHEVIRRLRLDVPRVPSVQIPRPHLEASVTSGLVEAEGNSIPPAPHQVWEQPTLPAAIHVIASMAQPASRPLHPDGSQASASGSVLAKVSPPSNDPQNLDRESRTSPDSTAGSGSIWKLNPRRHAAVLMGTCVLGIGIWVAVETFGKRQPASATVSIPASVAIPATPPPAVQESPSREDVSPKPEIDPVAPEPSPSVIAMTHPLPPVPLAEPAIPAEEATVLLPSAAEMQLGSLPPAKPETIPAAPEPEPAPIVRLLIGKRALKLKNGAWRLRQCALIDAGSREETTLEGDEASEMIDGLARLKIGSKWTLIDAKGQPVGDGGWDEIRDFAEGLAAVSREGKWGFIDQRGELKIPLRWDEAGPFSQGRARVRNGGSRTYIDLQGTVISDHSWDEVWRFFEDRGAVMSKGRWGFVDLTGKAVIPPVWDEVGVFSEGLARVRDGRKWGFIDAAGKVIIPPQWESVLDFSQGLARIRKAGQMGFIDPLGKIVIPVKYQDAGSFSEGFVDARVKGNCGYLDLSGQWAIEPKWKANRAFSNGLAQVSQDGKWGVISGSAEFVLNPIWEEIIAIKPLSKGPVFLRAIRQVNPASAEMVYVDGKGQEIWRGELAMTVEK